jgi:hypothetical protein
MYRHFYPVIGTFVGESTLFEKRVHFGIHFSIKNNIQFPLIRPRINQRNDRVDNNGIASKDHITTASLNAAQNTQKAPAAITERNQRNVRVHNNNTASLNQQGTPNLASPNRTVRRQQPQLVVNAQIDLIGS